ncbi:Iron-sulfur cluster-binding protein [Olavius algarvensis Delta 1 endosymbiont]|nr:Iron-sulfur cluster-binding protein [Olavius algarvensis Delta 1 endosymbiont]
MMRLQKIGTKPTNPEWNRRQFLVRSVKAGASIAAATAAGLWFHDSRGPTREQTGLPETERLDYAVDGLPPQMAIARGSDRRATVQSALKALGGIENFIKKEDRVLLKVNAAFASPAILSATTHPDIVSEMVRLCYQAGAASVAVTDNPINNPASCFTLSGIDAAARSAGARVYLPDADAFKSISIKDAKLIRNWPVLVGPLKNISKVIGLAPVKDHHRSGASLAMKNWYGLLGGRRNIFHQDINAIISELAMMVRPTMVILDGTVSMMTNGPTGGSLTDLKETETMIVSTDQVAADAFGATLLNKSSSDLPFIEQAAAAGLGTADYRSLNPVEINA